MKPTDKRNSTLLQEDLAQELQNLRESGQTGIIISVSSCNCRFIVSKVYVSIFPADKGKFY